jgi:CubicO group peptidase (beta-lactamase class C family)
MKWAFLLLALVIALISPACASPGPRRQKAILSALRAYAEQARVAWKVPGLSYAVVADGRLIAAEGLGVRNLASGRAVDPHTLFQIGSASKSFGSLQLAMLVDQGKLRWTDRVIDDDPASRGLGVAGDAPGIALICPSKPSGCTLGGAVDCAAVYTEACRLRHSLH